MNRLYRCLMITVIIILCIGIVFVAGFLIVLTIMDYRPEPVTGLEIKGSPQPIPPGKKDFSFFTWNIGYSGLGKEMDFFYEGGKRVRPGKEEFNRYLTGISAFVHSHDSVDFIFLQEVDRGSKRSYYTDEASFFEQQLPGFGYLFAKNYDSRFVPLPLSEPMGRVISGIMVFTKFNPVDAERHGFDVNFPWPKRLFFLKRCFLVLQFDLGENKRLFLVNVHNSTFDKGAVLRKKELGTLKVFLDSLYLSGSYVIAGGDWNMNPRDFDKNSITSGDVAKTVEPPLDPDFLPGWRCAFDPSHPTNRDVDMPYHYGVSGTTIIDFFFVSPNIDVREVRTIPVGFENSDHQPVYLSVSLK